MELFDLQMIAEGRRDAESVMLSNCVIKRPSGNTFDPELGHEVATFATVYTGPCGYDVDATQPREITLAGADFTLTNATAKLPIGSGAQANDLLEITSSQLNLPLPGTKAKLVELAEGTHRTAERWRAVAL